MSIDDAFQAVVGGRAIAFVGAGFSVDATNQLGARMPTGSQLATALMSELKSEESVDYSLAAELFVRERNIGGLHGFLLPHLTAAEISEPQRAIGGASWRRIYTTNFDNVCEMACHKVNRHYITSTPGNTPQLNSPSTTEIVHLHGYILTNNLDSGGIDLTRGSFVNPRIQYTRWPTQIQVDIESSDAVFIFGYSISDFHIAQLLRSTPGTRRKTFIVLEERPSQALCAYLERFGTILPIGLLEAARKLQHAAAAALANPGDHTPAPTLMCFDAFRMPEKSETPTTDASVALLLSGQFSGGAYLNRLVQPDPPFTFERRRPIALISRRQSPMTLVLHSRIGNGKSVCAEQCAFELSREGTHVFFARHPLPGITSEISQIQQLPGRKAFIFEGIRGYESAIRAAHEQLSVGDVLVVTARLSEFRGDFSALNNLLRNGYVRVDLDILHDEEIRDLEAWVAYYGLWGSIGGSSQPSRMRFIRERCGRELRAVILALFKTSTLAAKISSGLRDVEASGSDVNLAFTCLLVARYADCPLDFFDICELVDVDPYLTRDRLSDVSGTEFLQIDHDDFDIKSPILSEFLLTQAIPPERCFDALCRMVDALRSLIEADWRYEDSLPRLMRFSIIGKLFRRDGGERFVIGFYEHLLKFTSITKNPHFWLQFSMARLERDEFELAEKCLESAYKEARKSRGYRTYMIDNQKVKFLLKSRMKGNNYSDHSKIFEEAIGIFAVQSEELKKGLDVHVLRLIEPLIDFSREHAQVLPDHLLQRRDRAFEQVRSFTRHHLDSEVVTDEERRLLALVA